tara:strand:+ start:437 stop:763 length:327 start_codon:yes stop_codon:yes gene_type:complete
MSWESILKLKDCDEIWEELVNMSISEDLYAQYMTDRMKNRLKRTYRDRNIPKLEVGEGLDPKLKEILENGMTEPTKEFIEISNKYQKKWEEYQECLRQRKERLQDFGE